MLRNRRLQIRCYLTLFLVPLIVVVGCAKTQKNFHPPSFEKGESCHYSVATVEYGTEGPDVEVGIELLDNGNLAVKESLYNSVVEVDPKTLLPVRSEIIQKTRDGTYVLTDQFLSGGRLNYERKGPLSTNSGEIDLGHTSYHIHTMFLLFRAIDLTRGNTIRFYFFSPYSQGTVLARISVEGFEPVVIGEKTVESYRLLLRFEQYEVNAWIDASPRHQVLKFSNGVIELSLKDCD